MAIAETAARKLLHGATIAQGAADVGGISFGLWDLVTGFFSNILAYLCAAVAGVAHLLVLPLELLWQGLVTVAAAAAGAITSGLDGLCQHVSGFFAGIFAALASAPHLLVLPLEKLWQWLITTVADAAGTISAGLDGMWQHVTGFFAGIFAAVASAPHLLVLPLEKLWQWLVTTAANAAGAISAGFDDMWQHVTGFVAEIFAAVASAPHLLVLPLEKLWQWLVTTAANAAGAISAGFDDMWQHVTGFVAEILAALPGAAHQFVLPLETLWKWLATTTADAAGAVSSGLDGLWQLAKGFPPGILAHLSAAVVGAIHEFAQQLGSLWHWLLTNVVDGAGAISLHLDGLWQLVTGIFPKIFAALASASHELSQRLDELWQWIQPAVLPSVLGVTVILVLVALVWFCGSTLHAVAIAVCKVLVYSICLLGLGLYCIAIAVGRAVACLLLLLPACAQCLRRFCARQGGGECPSKEARDVVPHAVEACADGARDGGGDGDKPLPVPEHLRQRQDEQVGRARDTMKAPGAGGMLISRAAFVANPALYFLLLHTAGPVVASAVFCTVTVARIAAPHVAALFRGPVVECAYVARAPSSAIEYA
jgi:phage-related protein